jgi:2-dehydro-3-deoxygalactonokinase
VNQQSGKILATLKSHQGVKQTFFEWEKNAKEDQTTFYQKLLQNAIDQMSQKLNQNLDSLKIVLSGMASSSMGMKKLPYASLPMPLDGSQLIVDILPANAICRHEMYLISGLSKAGDAMRGEEIQAIGWHQVSAFMPKKCLLIIPGTHAKHLVIEDEYIIDFKTYMTGELYEIISANSVLKNSIQATQAWDYPNKDAFATGVKEAQTANISNQLFSIRARNLEGSLNKIEAAYYLSGLLIGYELKECTNMAYPIVLCCSYKFDQMYQYALSLLRLKEKTIILSQESVEDLAVWGQMTVLE